MPLLKTWSVKAFASDLCWGVIYLSFWVVGLPKESHHQSAAVCSQEGSCEVISMPMFLPAALLGCVAAAGLLGSWCIQYEEVNGTIISEHDIAIHQGVTKMTASWRAVVMT